MRGLPGPRLLSNSPLPPWESPAGPRGAVWQAQGHDGPQAQHLCDGGVEQGQPSAVLVRDSGAPGPRTQFTVQLLLQSLLNLGNGGKSSAGPSPAAHPLLTMPGAPQKPLCQLVVALPSPTNTACTRVE